MTKYNGKSKDELEKRANELNYNEEEWDNGTLGESDEHAVPTPPNGV